MEFSTQEIEMIGQTINEALRSDVAELNELQLATVGGGIGEVTLC